MLISWPYYGTRFFSMTCSCFTCRIVHIFTHVCCLNWLYPDSLSPHQPIVHDCFICVYIVSRELRCGVFRDRLGRISGFTSSICAHVLLVVLHISQLLFIIFIIRLSFLSDLSPLVSCIFSCFVLESKSECSDMTAYLLLLHHDHSPEYALHSARIVFSWASRIFDCVCIVTCCVTLSSFLDLKVLALALFSIIDLSVCASTSYRLSWHDGKWVPFGFTVSNVLASLLPLVSGRWEY
jgi:hypothetical protein